MYCTRSKLTCVGVFQQGLFRGEIRHFDVHKNTSKIKLSALIHIDRKYLVPDNHITHYVQFLFLSFLSMSLLFVCRIFLTIVSFEWSARHFVSCIFRNQSIARREIYRNNTESINKPTCLVKLQCNFVLTFYNFTFV